MANFKPICDWVLRIEDSKLSGVIKNLYDGQGLTRFGIGQHSHPEIDPTFWTTMETADALTMAEGVYKANYWDKFWGDAIIDQDVAASMLSFTVNDGLVGPIKMLQRLTLAEPDGAFGPITVAHVNSYSVGVIGPRLRAAQEHHYQMVVYDQPTDARFLAGWLKRAALVYPDLTGFV